jgi:diguanylate cyclase (GGDEF)-like protein
MNNQQPAIERIDPLTSCGNLLFFLETFSNRLSSPTPSPFSLLMVDLNNFKAFNDERGHKNGDELLRWVSIVLRDTQRPVFRIGGDELVVAFPDGKKDENEIMAQRIFDRLNRESIQFNWSNPASVVLIHFPEEKFEIADLWIAIGSAINEVKLNAERRFMIDAYANSPGRANHHMRMIVNTLTERLISFASRLDETNQLAYLDPNTQLPNSLAAERELESAIRQAQRANSIFTILFIDGDNLRLYNDIGYSAGDEMIRNLGKTLAKHLRPGDFLARWRVGDEFFVILPNTSSERALIVAERLRVAVEVESKVWQIPISISIGIADYPAKGIDSHELLYAAEQAEKQAKENGKNQAIYL